MNKKKKYFVMINTLFIEKNTEMILSLPWCSRIRDPGKVLFYEYSCFYKYFMY